MARTPKIYRKLPGTGGGIAGHSKLYLAEDHLMCVAQTSFTEQYTRFELSDIQAITARENRQWLVYLAIWGLLSAALIGLAVWVETPEAEATFFVLTLFTGVPFIYNLILGRTCDAMLYTAVSTQPLLSLNRLRRFYKVSDMLAPLIESRQGPLDPQQLHAAAQPDFATGPQPVVAAVAPAAPPDATPEKKNPERAVLWLSLALFGDAATTGLMFVIDRPIMAVLPLAFMLAITCLMVVGFATVPRTPTTLGLRSVLWFSFAFIIYSYSFLYFAFIVGSMNSVLPTASAFDAVLPSNSPVAYWCNIVSIALCLLLGAIGLLMVAGARSRR